MDGMRLGGMELEAWAQPGLPSKLAHPAFLALAARTVVTPAETMPWAVCNRPGHLAIGPELAAMPEGQALLRVGLEFAWLRSLPGITLDAALLLAGRAAGGFVRCQAADQRPRTEASAALLARLDSLAGELPAPAELLRAADLLRGTGIAGHDAAGDDAAGDDIAGDDAAGGGPPERTIEQATLLWGLAEACEALLVSGGDDRLQLDARTGLNRYGCAPWPAPEQIAFASSTASCISEAGQKAAEAMRQRLVADTLQAGDAASCIDRHTETAAAAILAHFGVTDLATAVLTASGTDAALIVTRLLQAEHPGHAMTSILMSPSETGSGVPEAVCAKHFAHCTASGETVRKGASLDGATPPPALLTVDLRGPDGTPRSREAITADCAAAIEAAIKDGQAVLHAIDGSKSGLAAPDRESCAALADRFGDRLDIVIDACQARIEPGLVRFYLERGFPVLVTGSKFFGAPGFCGAVLFPAARLRAIVARGRLAPELDAYAELAGDVLHRRCPGLLLRWEAALHDMRRFSKLSAPDIRQAIERFARSVRAQVMAAPRLSLYAAPRPAGVGWSGRRSVFTFAVHGAGGPLDTARLRPLYQALAAGERGPACLIGQPVEVGAGGLRVALSAGTIVTGEDQQHRLEAVFDTVQTLLGR
jgi:hypothetical protein